MVAQALIHQYLQTRQAAVLTASHTATGGATTTIIAAPGAGSRLIVVGGHVTAHTAGTGQWFHTSAAGGNELSGLMTLASGVDIPLGPWVLPENTLLACKTVTSNVRGTVAYFVAPL